jgi:CheY-like chemotaxis protein
MDWITRILSFDCGGDWVRVMQTVHFDRVHPPALTEAAADAVAAYVEAGVRRYRSPEAAMGAEVAIGESARRGVPARMGVRSVTISIHLPTAFSSTDSRRRSDVMWQGAGRGRILVVDDDPEARGTLQALLEDEFAVVAAAGVASAQAELATRELDVVLSDYEMPDGNGVDFLKHVQRVRPDLIGMLLTGHREYSDVAAATTDHTIFRVLLKPYDPEVLLTSVRSAFALARMRQSTARLPVPMKS